MTTISASAAESESGVWDGALSYLCRRYKLWSVLHCCQVIKRVRCLVQCCDPPLKTHPLQMLWKGKNLHTLKSLYKWGKPMRRGIIYRELVEDIKKNRKGRDSHSSENISYLKWGRRGSRRGRGKRHERSSRLSTATPGCFSGTCLQCEAQKELAGGVVSLFPI